MDANIAKAMKAEVPLYVVTGVRSGGGKRETLSLPCSRLKAVELRDWTRSMFGHLKVYQDIQIREV